MTYRHTQNGAGVAALVGGLAAVTGVMVGTSLARDGAPWPAWVVSVVAMAAVLGAAYTYSAMTVEVDAGSVRWHFRRGAHRREVPRAEIAAAEADATTLADGIGVHGWSRRMVYNVALGPAVRVVRRDGRVVVLGTDDPGGLVAALTAPPR